MPQDLISFVGERLPISLSQDIVRRLSLERFRQVLAYPAWNYVCQAVTTTRSYEAGLDAALMLLRAADEYKSILPSKEHSWNMQQIFQLILLCLDKLDRWEDYLQAWEQIRSNTDYAISYSPAARQSHGARIEPFILGEDSGTLRVHFLYSGSNRKSLIEHKLERKRQGQKIGNLLHASSGSLSVQDIEARLEWLRQSYEACRRSDA